MPLPRAFPVAHYLESVILWGLPHLSPYYFCWRLSWRQTDYRRMIMTHLCTYRYYSCHFILRRREMMNHNESMNILRQERQFLIPLYSMSVHISHNRTLDWEENLTTSIHGLWDLSINILFHLSGTDHLSWISNPGAWYEGYSIIHAVRKTVSLQWPLCTCLWFLCFLQCKVTFRLSKIRTEKIQSYHISLFLLHHPSTDSEYI